MARLANERFSDGNIKIEVPEHTILGPPLGGRWSIGSDLALDAYVSTDEDSDWGEDKIKTLDQAVVLIMHLRPPETWQTRCYISRDDTIIPAGNGA